MLVKFIYSEKATKCCEISTLLLPYVLAVKSKVEISQNFVAFSECMNFTKHKLVMPNEAFFHRNPKLLGLGKQYGQINFGAFRVFQSPKSQIFIWDWDFDLSCKELEI